MTDTDRLDALAAAATQGPWTVEGGYLKAGSAALTTVADMRYKNADANREFIVALVNAYRAGELAAVRELDELRAAAQKVSDYAEPDDDHEGQFLDYLIPSEALDALRAALHREDGA